MNTKINPRCQCDDKDCPRHGNCKACEEFHKNKEKPVFCKRKKDITK